MSKFSGKVEACSQNPENFDCLKECLPFNGKRTNVVIDAVRVIGLSLKESHSLLETSILSGLYYRITFGDRKFISAPVSGTSQSVWDRDSFELKWTPAAEKERLVIAVFDYDANRSDDFMGAIDIPVSELVFLKTGACRRRFKLGPTKSEKQQSRVPGELQLNLHIT